MSDGGCQFHPLGPAVWVSQILCFISSRKQYLLKHLMLSVESDQDMGGHLSQWTVILSLISFNGLVYVLESQCVYYKVGTDYYCPRSSDLTFWRRIFFLILAHPVFKMWVIQKPNKVALWNKRHFEEKKWRLYIVFKIFSTDICWINIKWGI